MTPLRHVRITVFQATQAEMAAIAGSSQPQWSRWEHGKREPSFRHLKRIRAEARRRRLAWDDRWLFESTGYAA